MQGGNLSHLIDLSHQIDLPQQIVKKGTKNEKKTTWQKIP
jgi:hypothetical protein